MSAFTERETIEIGGRNLAGTRKLRDAGETGPAAFVVDDVLPGTRWRARGIEVRGRAEVSSEGGGAFVADFAGELIRIFPERILGPIDPDAHGPNARWVG